MSSRQAKEYVHKQEHWGQYRTFENTNYKDYQVKDAGFTTDDRITGFDDITYEPSPEPVQPKPKPKKVNPNLFGFHPGIAQQSDNDLMAQQRTELLKDGGNDDKTSTLTDTSSVNRVNRNFANTRDHPKHFQYRASMESHQDIDKISFKSKLLGILCIIIAISSWVALAHILKHQTQSNYDKPYFMSYCITAGLLVLFVPWLVLALYDKYNKRQQFTEHAFKNETTYTKQEILVVANTSAVWKRLLIPSFIFCVLVLSVNYLWIISLEKTMVSVNTTLYQSNVAVIYVLSIFLLDNLFTWQKNIGVVFCGAGVVTVLFGAYKEEDETENGHIKNQVSGIVECIVSVLCYSVNAVLFKMTAVKYFRAGEEIKTTFLLQWMTGFIGLLILWPVMFILDSLEVETFEWPQTSHDTVMVILAVLLNVVFFASLFTAIIFTNPLFASIGLLFVLPVGYFSDIILHSYSVEWASILGTLFIAIGFVLLNVPVLHYVRSRCRRTNG